MQNWKIRGTMKGRNKRKGGHVSERKQRNANVQMRQRKDMSGQHDADVNDGGIGWTANWQEEKRRKQ